MGIIKPESKDIFRVNSEDLKYLYQLRVGLSALRAHKFKHNFKDTPNDKCSCSTGPENTLHFLLSCPFFTSQRAKLLETVNPLLCSKNLELDSSALSKALLYGNNNLNPLQNKTILEATLEFIRNSGRFDREKL